MGFKKGHPSWNKGKINVYSKTILKKMSESKKDSIPWNKGKKGVQVAWNKNKTYEELYGKEKANKLKQISSNTHKGKFSPFKDKSFKEQFGEKKAKEIKGKISKTIKKSYNKGRKTWNKGIICKPLSKKHKEKISKKLKGRISHKKGIKLSKKTIEKMSGKNSSAWRGGKSFEPYSPEFNNQLKEFIRQRDQYRCQQCFRHQDELFNNTKAGMRPYKLHIHHIDYNKQNNKPENLICLCKSCHAQTNFKRKDWETYFKNKLI